MSPRFNKSVTLLELLIAISLLGILVLAFTSIDLFSRYHVISSDRRAKLQNEVTFALEHMTKEISKAIGDANNNPVTISGQSIQVYIDANRNGLRDDGGNEITYRYINNEIQYCHPGCDSIAKNISACSFTHNWTASTRDNYITADVTACWDPTGVPVACGNPDNPSVSMLTRIKMPSVSTN